MTTYNPSEPYSEAELKQLYPDNLQLEQVQVLLRHGERTPVNARFQNAGLRPYWPYCNAARKMRSVLLSQNGDWDYMTYHRKLETFDKKDDNATFAGSLDGENGGICLPGELTDVGRRTTLSLGSRLRDLYISRLHFLPDVLSETTQSQLYIRATPIPRALESVQQTFLGLYPISSRNHDLPAPTIVTRQPSDETLFPNEGACKRFRQLAVAFGDRAAEIWNDSPELRYVNSKIGNWMPAESPAVKVDSHPRLSGVMDTINSTLAHGPATKLPSAFYDSKLIANIDRIAVDEWFTGYRVSSEYRRLGIGALVGDITARLVERARAITGSGQRAPDVRFALSGCHDTTLAAVLASLGTYNDEPWPPYTSHIAIELLRERGAKAAAPTISLWGRLFPASPGASRAPLSVREARTLDDFYVRVRYNDRVMRVPGCKEAGKHREGDEGLCTLVAFKEIVDKFTPKDWKQECGMGLGKAAMPEKEEAAGF